MTKETDVRTLSMSRWTAVTVATVATVGVLLGAPTAHAQAPAKALLTAQDRADIEQLLVTYSQLLSSCQAKKYSELFTPDAFFFSDDFRGARHRELYGKSATLVGRAKLIELVETEEFCLHPEAAASRARAGVSTNRPQMVHVIEPTPEGATGTVKQANGGRSENVYVKTGDGWRFKSRSVFMAPLTTLSEQDRTDIQGLVARYASSLRSCAGEEYADLFAGYFGSGSRGQVATRENLIGLVKSERACITPNPNPTANGGANAAARRAPNGPTVNITATVDGATGTPAAGGTGYFDVYVKTPKGWRFQSRNVLSAAEVAAKMTVDDFIEIRKLAGDEIGHYADTYKDSVDQPHDQATPGNGPGRQFRASGLVITATPEGVTGRAFLRHDGGHYDDAYVKTANGWRFKSRVYVPPAVKP